MNLASRIDVVARSWAQRFRKTRRLAGDELYRQLHSQLSEPGLTNVTNSGVCRNDGFDIPFFEFGPADATTTVVFFHGFALSSEGFYDQVKYLRRTHPQVRLLLIDVRGHGLADPAPSAECTVEGAADDVLAVVKVRASYGRLVLVGHSLGGMIALNFIRRCPKEVYERIDGAVLISTSIRQLSEKGLAQILQTRLANSFYTMCCRLPERANFWRHEIAKIIAPALSVLVAGFPRMERIQFHVSMLIDTPLSSYVGFFDDLLRHSEYAAADRLSRLSGTIVVGAADIITPRSQAEFLAKYWPKARLCVVEGAGHMVILEEPEQISEEIARLL